MKVVIISKLIYPANAPRPFRATELAKEFARQGHDVTLYGLLGNYDYTDFQSKTKIKVKTLGKTIFSKVNSDGNNRYSLLNRVINKLLRPWLEFPDIELAKKTFKVLEQEENIDLLISVAVPYPIHWGVAWHKTTRKNKYNDTTWIADCGDPYMGNPFNWKPFYFKYVEKWFCRQANYLTVPIEEAKRGYYPEFLDKIKVIPQGFDFNAVSITSNYVPNKVPTFIYAGTFYHKLRDPSPLLQFLCDLDMDFHFKIYTKAVEFVNPYKDKLGSKLTISPYIERTELIYEMSKADFLVNIQNKSSVQSPSKLIDYGLSKRPILNIVDETDISLIKNFIKGDYSKAYNIEDIDYYNIKNVVNKFIDLKTTR